MTDTVLSQERLHQLLDYSEESGEFRWKESRRGLVNAGDIAGGKQNGYISITVDGLRRGGHQLAWLYVYGEWPKQHIDHINGDRSDNRISNLRDVSCAINLQNLRKPYCTNTSGYMGVSHQRGKWVAQIQVNGQQRWLGTFKTPEEAHAVYVVAKAQLHGILL